MMKNMRKFLVEKFSTNLIHVLLIHGAWSTSTGFNYIHSFLRNTPGIGRITLMNYDARYSTMDEIVAHGEKILNDLNEKTIIIGHSLGGIIALALAKHKTVASVLTLAAPIGGIEVNKWFRRIFDFFSATRAPVLSDIVKDSDFMKKLHHTLNSSDSRKTALIMLIAGEGYNPSIMEPSDGVLTIRSQEDCIPYWADKRILKTNHSEILQFPDTINAIKELVVSLNPKLCYYVK